MTEFRLPPSPFEAEHEQVDAMLGEVRKRPKSERVALQRLNARRRTGSKLTDKQRREIGRSTGARSPVAYRYGISEDHVGRLRSMYKRGLL